MLGLSIPIPLPASAAVSNERPADIVDLAALVPDIAHDIRYVTAFNFIGRPIAGYRAPKCLLTRPAAEAIGRVQAELREHGYGLKVYDCYRPQRAVDEFVEWARDPQDQAMKPVFYPQVAKTALFSDGYIAARSGHSRASTVDLTIVRLPAPPQPGFDQAAASGSCEAFQSRRFADNSIDMGTGYDCFSPLSHTDYPATSPRSRANRQLLKTLMEHNGFENLPQEWWHYSLRDEPYPATWFDFPVE